ncbi:MAG: hypothetical protein ACI9OO_000459, partial [Bacteroidia bacterium]
RLASATKLRQALGRATWQSYYDAILTEIVNESAVIHP